MRRRLAITTILLGICLLLGGCKGPPQGQTSTPAGPKTGIERRDLRWDEARGGHTLARHVGRTDAELRERLRRETNIRAASTYTDTATAEETVAAAIASNEARVRRWTSRTGPRPNLVLDYDASHPVGRTLHRNATAAEPCAHAIVVLRWSGAEYYVLTSYPEC